MEFNLGPGAYELRKTQSAHTTVSDIVKASFDLLFLSIVFIDICIFQQPRPNTFKFNRKSLPPSIPDPKLAYGFEEDASGALVPQQAPQRDASIGPAFYNPPAAVCFDTL